MATYVSNVRLFDGERVRERAGVLASDGRIEWVGAHARAPRAAARATGIHGSGRTLTPGLIDCHVHLCFDGSPDFVSEAAVTEPYAAVKCVANARRQLEGGVTTVRDLGGFGAVVCDVGRAIGRTGIQNCIRAGIDSIEHGSQITAEIAREMKAKGIVQVPTISALDGIISHPEDVPAFAVEKGMQIWEMAQAAFRRTIRAGARHACGTDAGTPHNPHGGAAREIAQMIEWGLSPIQALRSATANAAELLRVPEVGTVEVGKAADLVLYEANPIEDPATLLRPLVVWKSGEDVAGRDAGSR